MTMIKGSYLCVGANAEPGVKLLTADDMAAFYRTMAIIRERVSDARKEGEEAQAYAKYFYAGVEIVIPAWIPDAMLSVVENYTGPHRERARILAALIYQGMTFSNDGGKQSHGPTGGQPALIDPVKPKPRKPSGGARIKTPVASPSPF
jgi:hypothetical protein